MFNKVLIANRGEIACRIIRTLDRMKIASVAVYSEADTGSGHVAAAGEAICIGPAQADRSYLRGDLIIEAALKTGAQAIHPGYGFLSENPAFAQMCADAGLVFIGPTAEQMRNFGLKHTAREIAQKTGVPLLPGTDLLETPEEAIERAEQIGFPVMLKSTAGGGGIGMRLCHKRDELSESFAAVQRLGKNNFKHAGIYLEKYVTKARHIEVQIFGDKGDVIALGERDCSTQRRNQKVIEETPAPLIDATLRAALFDAAVRLGKAVGYQSAGTVEFILDAASGQFYFLEVNTRLQVEHGVTEEVTGIDLVEWMIRQAAGEMPPLATVAKPASGAAIQVRLYAEDPSKNFRPCSGVLQSVAFPESARVETWVKSGTEVTAFYDPLVAKIIARGANREEALDKLKAALSQTSIWGIETNLEYLRGILDDPTFAAGRVTTQFLSTFHHAPHTIDVLKPGTQTTVQDFPGRLGYWAIGVPPSGPMDALAFRIANRLVGNATDAAGLEITANGPSLRFNLPLTIALCGAPMDAKLNGNALAYWQAVRVQSGDVLEMGAVTAGGVRAYLAVSGGFDTAPYLNSRSTFTLGKFGGHAGRPLRAGDVLRVLPTPVSAATEPIDPALIPSYSGTWEIGVLYGPHGAPDFFTQGDIDTFFTTAWKVHYNSDRTGVRLIGPHPQWARKDGGEAGLHPSNIHDNAYAIGAVDFTGNMPVILGPDGPSLGGFVCPVVIAQAELWKIGQLRPGDTVRFLRQSDAQAAQRLTVQDAEIASLKKSPTPLLTSPAPTPADSPILHEIPATPDRPRIIYRRDGDQYLLIEYGPLELDINLRFRVHVLMEHLERNPLPGVIDLTPGIRSLHVHYDSRVLPLDRLLKTLIDIEPRLPDVNHIEVPTRIVHLPLSWDDAATQLAIHKYMQSVRKDAPWCPSNIEFIRRINGLASIDEVHRIVFEASYLVLGLGDVYLGAPVATPIDPRHRLVTTKYNPARTWTPENAVGIGGAYLCVYGMEGPGGYQFVGRTCQMYNAYNATADFTDSKPWLLRFFDQLRFYPVSADELLRFREQFPHGRVKLKIEHETFSLKKYNEFLAANRDSIQAFKHQQQTAFHEERLRWEAAGQAVVSVDSDGSDDAAPSSVSAGSVPVLAEVSGSIWKIDVEAGQQVAAGDRVAIIESMKMEIPVHAPAAGTIEEVFCNQGKVASAGQILFAIKP
jgi:urea carboxylase